MQPANRIVQPAHAARIMLLFPGIALAGCGGPARTLKPYTIQADFRQMISFQTAALPDNIFKVVIPEIITDRQETLVPWSQEPPVWHIDADRAWWECRIPGKIRMRADMRFGDQVIEAEVEMTNLSDRTWENANAFTCFAFYSAPLFDDPSLNRIYFPVGGKWRAVGELFAEHSPGTGPYTFFPVAGGPALDDMNVCRLVKQRHPQVADYGAACVVSKDGRWVLGVNADRPAYVFCNRCERCIHANPVFEPIAPGQTARAATHIRILRGGIADFERLVRPRQPQL